MDNKRATTIIHRPDASELKRLQEAAAIKVKDPLTIVIFGASGDLSRRKLIPALYHLQKDGFLPARFAVVGFSRTPTSDEKFRSDMVEAIREALGAEAPPDIADNPLVKSLYYVAGNNDDAASFAKLKEKIDELERTLKLPGNRLFYLSVSPPFFPVIVKQLGKAKLIHLRNAPAWSRVIIEKPFGRDLESAKALNDEITGVLDESQIYRIDHYLGKETVQNILSFRFGNSIFEPLFNQKYVDSVQITVAETIGMEGKRGAYYDTAGALRDMVQNHLLQLLTLVAMEPPPAFEANSVRDAKVMLLRSLTPMTTDEVAGATVRGQYGAGTVEGKAAKAYREEENVRPDSNTETFVALRIKIDNWRWAGVPFYLRTGKRLKKRLSEIVVTFKKPPTQLFRPGDGNECLLSDRPCPNQLIFHIQPDEGISLLVACKEPGLVMKLDEVDMSFLYREAFKQRSPEAYERLLLDALRGDQSLFTRTDEVYQAWVFATSILNAWSKMPPSKFPNYAPHSDGPEEAKRLVLPGTEGWRAL